MTILYSIRIIQCSHRNPENRKRKSCRQNCMNLWPVTSAYPVINGGGQRWQQQIKLSRRPRMKRLQNKVRANTHNLLAMQCSSSKNITFHVLLLFSEKSFRECLLSRLFLWHLIWLSVMQLRHYLFIGTLNPMLQRLTEGEPSLGNTHRPYGHACPPQAAVNWTVLSPPVCLCSEPVHQRLCHHAVVRGAVCSVERPHHGQTQRQTPCRRWEKSESTVLSNILYVRYTAWMKTSRHTQREQQWNSC